LQFHSAFTTLVTDNDEAVPMFTDLCPFVSPTPQVWYQQVCQMK